MKKIIFASFLALLSIISMGDPTFIVQADASSTCVSISHSLHYQSGDAGTGGDVTKLQNYLYSARYLNSPATGYFGSLTLAAVKQYQAKQGIDATGTVGPLTRASIGTVSCSSKATTSTSGSVTSGTTSVSGGSTVTVAPACSLTLTYPYLNAYLSGDTFQTITWNVGSNCTATTSIIAVLMSLDGTKQWNISPSGNSIPVTNGTLATDFSKVTNGALGFYKVALELSSTNQIVSNIVQANLNLPAQQVTGPSINSLSVNSVSNDGQTLITLNGSNFASTSAIYLGGSKGFKIKPNTVDTNGSNLTFYVPTAVGIGYYSLTVSNNEVLFSQAVSFNVTGPATSRYVITTTVLQNPVVGQSYYSGIQATGFINNYTWSVLSGTLPPGLSLTSNPNGYLAPALLNGVPETAGEYSFTVQASDGTNIAKQAYSVTVLPDPNVTSKVPLIYSLSQTSAATGTAITIKGTRLASTKNYVLFNGRVGAGPLTSDGSSLSFNVPIITSPDCNLFTTGGFCPNNLQVLTSGTYTVTVESAGGSSNGLDFTLIPHQY